MSPLSALDPYEVAHNEPLSALDPYEMAHNEPFICSRSI